MSHIYSAQLTVRSPGMRRTRPHSADCGMGMSFAEDLFSRTDFYFFICEPGKRCGVTLRKPPPQLRDEPLTAAGDSEGPPNSLN